MSFNRCFPLRSLLRASFHKSSFCCRPGLARFDGPGLEHFLANSSEKKEKKRPLRVTPIEDHPYITEDSINGRGRKVYFDVYGCQMNVSDTEVVWSILKSRGYHLTEDSKEADVWLIVTCSIRDGAEQKIWKKLNFIKWNKKKGGKFRKDLKVGVLGCMAERLKDRLFSAENQLVDVVVGPDAYKDLPRLLAITEHSDQSAINVILSAEETYADVMPVRLNADRVTSFVSIQRGCDNMCSYCIVPFTRGRERSRPMASIIDEVKMLSEKGIKEVTLLGQNVNSYRDTSSQSTYHLSSNPSSLTSKFRTVYKPKIGGARFADLLLKVSEVDPEMRVRFTSPHPKDFPDEVLSLILEKPNICRQIHLPAQSGSSRILELMRRGYDRGLYLDLVARIREFIPNISLSSDFIAGFCGEGEVDFDDTLSLIKTVEYNKIFAFQYSLREKTQAHRKLVDDVPSEVKTRRLVQIHSLYREHAHALNSALIGTKQLVLIEGDSKRSSKEFVGKTDGNVKVIFHKIVGGFLSPGDYVVVEIQSANSETLKGTPLYSTTLSKYYQEEEEGLNK